MRKRRIIPTVPINFYEDVENKDKYQRLLYGSILDGVEQSLKTNKNKFIIICIVY